MSIVSIRYTYALFLCTCLSFKGLIIKNQVIMNAIMIKLILVMSCSLLGGCMTFNNLSTGRSLGKGIHEITPSLSSYYVEGKATTPSLPQVIYNYGLTEKMDVGANISYTAENLVQFALMGSGFQKTRGIKRPKVGLLNIGSEEKKGTMEIRKAYQILQRRP